MGLFDWLHSLTDSKYSGSNVEMSNDNNQTWVDALHQATDSKYDNSNFEMGGGYGNLGSSWKPTYSYEPEETPVIGDNGQPIYYGSKDSRTFDNKIWNGDFENQVDENTDEETEAGSMDDPDKILRDTYNEWYRWKNGLEGDDQDHFYDTYGAFLGYDDGSGYVGTAQDWYDLLNQTWLEGDDRLEKWYGGNADFSVRNDYAEAYDNLFTEADENGNHYIPLEVIEDWYNGNLANNKITEEQLLNLDMFGDSDLIGSKYGSGQSVMDAISNIVTRGMMAQGLNPLEGASPELQQMFRDYQRADDSEKGSLMQRINNAYKAERLKGENALNLSPENKASYLNSLLNNIYGDSGQKIEAANDRTHTVAPDESLAYLLLNSNMPQGYHAKTKGEAPAPTVGQQIGGVLGALKQANIENSARNNLSGQTYNNSPTRMG